MPHDAPRIAHEIPFVDLKTPHRELRDEILGAWKRLLEDAAFVGGPEVERFESELAAHTGTAHAVGMASGTDALRLALIGMGLSAGDEVITVPHTFIASTEAISQAGGRPVFVDVDPVTATLDPTRVEAAITPRTRFLMPVHLYGQTADMGPLQEIARRHDLQILEDACQAHGAEYRGVRAGRLGRAAAFSFYPGKNLGACGEGGAVTTDDETLAARMRMLRDHGQAQKYRHEFEGWNGRLHSIQAAALRIKLRHLDAWNEARRSRARRYARGLAGSGVDVPLEAPGRKHVWHLYVVRHAERDRLQAALGDGGIGTGLHYPVPLHLQKAYAGLGLGQGAFPESERWASQCLSLPLFPDMTDDQVDRVCEAVRAVPR